MSNKQLAIPLRRFTLWWNYSAYDESCFDYVETIEAFDLQHAKETAHKRYPSYRLCVFESEN